MQSNTNGAAERSGAKPRVSGWVLASLALSMLLSSLGISIANVALPALAQAFDAPFQHVQWVVLAYLLAVTIMIVSAGRLGDIFGHKRVLLFGIALFMLASAACGLVSSLWMLVAARALQGLGASVLMALTIASVRDIVADGKTGSAMGLLGTMSAIGTALGPSLGGFLLASAGWRAIFLVMVPLGVLNLLLASRFLPASRPAQKAAGFDGPGTLLLGAALAAFALAATSGGGRFGWSNAVLLAGALVAGGLFLLVEARVASPLIRPSAFRNAGLSGSLAMNMLVSTVMMATFVVGPFYLSRALGLNAASVGLVLSVGPVIATLTGIPAGRVVDRLGASAVVLVGLTLMAAGAFALATMPAAAGVAGYIAGIAVLTPGYQLFQAANNTAVMMDVAPDRRGVVSGMLSLSRNLGLIIGASVIGAVFALASGAIDGAAAPPEAVAAGMRPSVAVAGGVMLAAIAIGYLSRRRLDVALAEDRG